MARLAQRVASNAAGDFYVDASCIDCETCRATAPSVFGRDARLGQSVVREQPRSADEERRALMALVACPTASIGTVRKRNASAAAHAFPEIIDGEVYTCGYAAESSFGASSYLIRRPGGNVLVDSPRAARPLMQEIGALGGVDLMFLSHRDDVADHRSFQRHFGCRRILHAADVGADTSAVEWQLQGEQPVAIADDLLAIPVPGHTRGSAALLYRNRYLFTGNHLWADEDTGRLAMSRSVCWYSWRAQLASLAKLLKYDLEWVLPGHGRRFQAASAAEMRGAITELLSELNAP
jgi:glyoxylase-like metal-dependent hydrolase (beta-lactamase superfamily II)/ferredoxin